MTDIVLHRDEQIKSNLIKLSETRDKIANCPEVYSGLSDTEYKVVKQGSKKALKTINDSELIKAFSIITTSLYDDLGIRSRDNIKERAIRFYDICKNYYSDFTIAEVKIAFELAYVGKLDEYLPKDSTGKPDRNHYQEFSVDFITKILNAFKMYKQKVWVKARHLLPEKQEEITGDEKQIYRSSFIDGIYQKFALYRDFDERPIFMVPFLVLKEFQKAGIIDGNIVVTQENISKGFIRMTQDNNISKYHKSEMAKRYENGEVPEEVEKKAIKCAYEDLIIKVFDKFIEEGMDIQDVIIV